MDKHGGIGVDFIGRYETFEDDYASVCAHMNIDPPCNKQVNASRHDHYSTYYDDYTRELVSRKFALDINMFGYSF